MLVWLVEENPFQAGSIQSVLKQAFPDAEFERFGTESDFLAGLARAKKPPTVVIMDVMLPWTQVPSVGEVQKAPDGYEESGGFYRAGLRCIDRLHELESTRSVPVVLLTVLTNSDLDLERKRLPQGILYVSKREEPGSLVRAVRELTGLR
jgi:CheY-like chemotaxis protein